MVLFWTYGALMMAREAWWSSDADLLRTAIDNARHTGRPPDSAAEVREVLREGVTFSFLMMVGGFYWLRKALPKAGGKR